MATAAAASGIRDLKDNLSEYVRRAEGGERIAVTDEILTRAGRPFPVEPIRTLDAIHLTTIELLGETPQFATVITRDECVARNARALGYDVA